jgi:hypothetical protein
MTDEHEKSRKHGIERHEEGEIRRNSGRHIPQRSTPGISPDRTIRASAPPYRWVCPCQEPPVLLATYDPAGKLNIKVRDRYWHLYGFGHVQAICPRCGAEHLLDLRELRKRTAQPTSKDGGVLAG